MTICLFAVNLVVDTCGGHGVCIDLGDGFSGDYPGFRADFCHFVGCWVASNNKSGIYFGKGVTATRISDSYIVNNGENGILAIESRDMIISNNHVLANATKADPAASPPIGPYYGIHLAQSGGVGCEQVIITGNQIGLGGYYRESGMTHCKQKFGLCHSGSGANFIVAHNNFWGNLEGAIYGLDDGGARIVKDNLG